MELRSDTCYRCRSEAPELLAEKFGYTVCETCISKLGLLKDKTIRQHLAKYAAIQEADPRHISYAAEIQRRLAFLDQDYIDKQIKLLHVLDRVGKLSDDR